MAIKSSGIKVGRYRIGKGIAGRAKKTGASARKKYASVASRQKALGARARAGYAAASGYKKK